MRLLLSALLVLLCLTGVMAQSNPAMCGNVPVDVTFKPSNCLEAGGEATLETTRYRSVAIVNLFITGANGRVGGGDRGVRVDGDGVLRLRIDTTDFFGAQIPAGDYSVIIKDVTGRISPIIAPFNVAGASGPATPTARATTTPGLPNMAPTATRTTAPNGTPTATVQGTPSRTPTGTVRGTPNRTPTGTVQGTPNRTPTATTGTANSSLCALPVNPNDARDDPIFILDIDKLLQVVTLTSKSSETINLDGWTMCSLTGSQVHQGIGGVIEPNESRDFAYTGSGDIWNENEQDNGALYDATGNLVSYFEDLNVVPDE